MRWLEDEPKFVPFMPVSVVPDFPAYSSCATNTKIVHQFALKNSIEVVSVLFQIRHTGFTIVQVLWRSSLIFHNSIFGILYESLNSLWGGALQSELFKASVIYQQTRCQAAETFLHPETLQCKHWNLEISMGPRSFYQPKHLPRPLGVGYWPVPWLIEAHFVWHVGRRVSTAEPRTRRGRASRSAFSFASTVRRCTATWASTFRSSGRPNSTRSGRGCRSATCSSAATKTPWVSRRCLTRYFFSFSVPDGRFVAFADGVLPPAQSHHGLETKVPLASRGHV